MLPPPKAGSWGIKFKFREGPMRKLLNLLFTWLPFYYILLAVIFFGTLYGFWWCRRQFIETNFLLWPYVPNSPLAVLYFFIALLFFLRGKRSVFWEGLAYFGLIKYGMWTVAIITSYHLAGRHKTAANGSRHMPFPSKSCR